MSKICLFAFLLASTSLVSTVACSSSSDDAAEAPKPDPVIGPTGPSGPVPTQAEAGIPVFDFPGPGAPVEGGTAADAGADVQPIEMDPGAAQGARAWGVDVDGRLVSFRVNAPDQVSVKLVTGLPAGEKILAVDFRPAGGGMFALGSESHIYTIDRATGAVTSIGDGAAFTPGLHGQARGFDVNPVADKLRIHTDTDQNLRLDPLTGKVVTGGVDGTLSFISGDVNFGQSPNIVATAYTNSVSPAPATTMLYGIDSTRNLLTRLPAPNDGMVETVGSLGVEVEQAGGFDIAKDGTAYAVMRVAAENALYTIALDTGAATKVGVIGYPLPLASVSIEP